MARIAGQVRDRPFWHPPSTIGRIEVWPVETRSHAGRLTVEVVTGYRRDLGIALGSTLETAGGIDLHAQHLARMPWQPLATERGISTVTKV
jgi:hypothetical protein